MELAKIFSDNMVLQAGKAVYFFGKGAGKVKVSFAKQSYEKTFAEENWALKIPPQPYGEPLDVVIELAGEKRMLNNVVFGDVFLCAGQSNMQFTIREEKGENLAQNDKHIRYFCCDRPEEHNGIKSADGWLPCENDKWLGWSALGTHIAQYYREKRDVYVGVIGCFQGASGIRSWLPKKALDESVFIPLELLHGDYRHEKAGIWNSDSFLYDHTFSPIVPYAVKAVVWYQGETDTTVAEGKVYMEMLVRLIQGWRSDLKDTELPFVVVEICDYEKRMDEGWYIIQHCQREVETRIQNVRVVSSKDVCEHCDIHPTNKQKLAKKIASVL